MAEQLGMGVIGCGGISAAHLPAQSTIEGMRTVAVCDLNQDAARKAADWTMDQLRPDNRDFLRNLPEELPFNGACLGVHGPSQQQHVRDRIHGDEPGDGRTHDRKVGRRRFSGHVRNVGGDDGRHDGPDGRPHGARVRVDGSSKSSDQ